MPLSMYQASAPVFVRQLGILSTLLKTGETFAAAQGIDPAALIEARLAPDMLPLPRQVQIATDGAKGCVARLGQIEPPSYEDTEASFAELQERLAKTIAFIQGVPAAAIDGSEERTITLKFGKQDISMTGQAYLLDFVLPNVFFHIVTAYDILRHKGVPLGKLDYLGAR